MSKAISLAIKLNFITPEGLEFWLQGKSAEWAQVIAARTALRVLPLAGTVYQSDVLNEAEKNRLTLSVYRSCFIILAVGKWSTNEFGAAISEATKAATVALYAADSKDKFNISAANVIHTVQIAITTFLAKEVNPIDTARAAINTVGNFASNYELYGATYASNNSEIVPNGIVDIWNTISHDANWLASRPVNSSAAELLMNTRLWPDGEPDWMYDQRVELNRILIRQSKHHQVWINWYSNVLNGKSFFDLSAVREKELTLNIASRPNKFWEQDFAKISKDISEWLAEARIWDAGDAEQRQLDDEEQETASVPPIKSASVQPVWVNGRLVQSTAPMHAELKDELLAAFAQALRNEIAALANAAQQSNFDKRGLALLAETANLMPDTKPDAVLLFQLIFREAQLSDQIDLINDQWPTTLSTRYCTLLRQLRDYLDRFSERRQFNRDKLETDLENIDFDDLDQDVSDFGNVLRSDDVNIIVDVSIPDALDSIGAVPENLQSIEMPPVVTGRLTQIVKAADQIESVNNISREILNGAGVENAARLGETGKAAYIQGIEDHYVDASYEAGREDAKKAAKLANRGAMGFAAGKSIRNRLGKKYPKFFGWMKRDDD